MVVQSASRFMQRIGKKTDSVAMCFDAYKAKYVHTTILDF